MPKQIHVLGGGTIFDVRPHFHIGARAKGTTAKKIANLMRNEFPWPEYFIHEHLTEMADPHSKIRTNADVAKLVDGWVADPSTKIIVMSAALCDFTGTILAEDGTFTPSGTDQPRLKTSHDGEHMFLQPAQKIIGRIRKERKDIFLVGFKTTAGATPEEQFEAGLSLLKKNSCNLVLANDVHTKLNMIVAPEVTRYCVTHDRDKVLKELVKMTRQRQGLSFTRTTIEEGDFIKWDSVLVPETLRKVVNNCIDRGAYKPFNDVTVGHFGYRVAPGSFFSSRRKRNFNKLEDCDLVTVMISDDKVQAFGGKPSAGAYSQYMVLTTYPEYDCIVHFHCPAKPDCTLVAQPQSPYECGSHECGRNTANGLKKFGNLGAVMLDNHGPNIVFSSNGDPDEVIKFIEENFDLTKTTRE